MGWLVCLNDGFNCTWISSQVLQSSMVDHTEDLSRVHELHSINVLSQSLYSLLFCLFFFVGCFSSLAIMSLQRPILLLFYFKLLKDFLHMCKVHTGLLCFSSLSKKAIYLITYPSIRRGELIQYFLSYFVKSTQSMPGLEPGPPEYKTDAIRSDLLYTFPPPPLHPTINSGIEACPLQINQCLTESNRHTSK